MQLGNNGVACMSEWVNYYLEASLKYFIRSNSFFKLSLSLSLYRNGRFGHRVIVIEVTDLKKGYRIIVIEAGVKLRVSTTTVFMFVLSFLDKKVKQDIVRWYVGNFLHFRP